MAKRPLTAAEEAAYRELAQAAAKLRKAQAAAERKRVARPKKRPAAESRQGQGVADA